MIIELIGWIGMFLIFCAPIPQLFTTLRTRSFKGLSVLSVAAIASGCLLALIYVAYTAPKLPLIINYLFNLLLYVVILCIYPFRVED
jgi:uncharacterized protein with PQ loop repeat